MEGMEQNVSSHGSRSCTVRVSRIPYAAVAKELFDFLSVTIGSNTVFACKILTEKLNWKSKGFGFVQFEAEDVAEKAVNLAKKCRLKFQGSLLQMEFEPTNLVDRPQLIIPIGRLSMGCLVSSNKLQVYWSTEGVVNMEVDFVAGKLRVFLGGSGNLKEYKLTWNLLELKFLHSSKTQEEHISLLIQVKYAPKIGQKVSSDEWIGMRGTNQDRYTLFRDNINTYDIPWSRGLDFTENQSVGQSFYYHLEIATAGRCAYQSFLDTLSSIGSDVPECSEKVSLEIGSLFSAPHCLLSSLELHDLKALPFTLIFQINHLVQQGLLIGPNITNDFLKQLHPSTTPLAHTQQIFRKLSESRKVCYSPCEWFVHEVKILQNGCLRRPLRRSLAEEQVFINRIKVTPTRIYCIGPEVELSNRVLRHYKRCSENFIRVSFSDEDMDGLSSKALTIPSKSSAQNDLRERPTDISRRIHEVLKHGIELGGKKFEFLAFSASQLREHSVWMFASKEGIDANSIRAWMGEFSNIKNIANCAIRMGQCFSSSRSASDVSQDQIEVIPDIERQSRGIKYCFSDGIGKISWEFGEEVAKKCGCAKKEGKTPSAFQIRYGGYKGVVAVHPASLYKLSLRPSMKKFESSVISLDILEWSRFLPCYLNRQIITLLSTLGIVDTVFEELQKERISTLDQMFTSQDVALITIESSCGGDFHNIMKEMLLAGYSPRSEPFLESMLLSFKRAQIQDIQKKSKILVPEGRVLMGCLDEHGTLEYGEVFIQVSATSGSKLQDDDEQFLNIGVTSLCKAAHVVKGRVVVAKNPCLHPGDIRILNAVDSSYLQHMVDCIVFPQKGSRPHPHECSGSDLDGDLYFVAWDERLIPSTMDAPMDYYPPKPIALDHSPTLEEIQTYFVDYMRNDSLGTIANAHVVFADKEPEKARSWQCRELAELASIAVDFPKTGVPAILPKMLRPHSYPDFMEKNTRQGKRTYVSSGVLGKLYRAAKEISSSSYLNNRSGCLDFYDTDLIFPGKDLYTDRALRYRNHFNEKLMAVMDYYGVQNEADMFTGFFSQLLPTLNNASKGVKERIQEAVIVLKREALAWFDDTNDDPSSTQIENKQFAKASAWYHVTYHPDFARPMDAWQQKHLLSFPWVVYDKLLCIKRFNQMNKGCSMGI